MSLDSISDALRKKADSIDFSKGDDLSIIQTELDRLFDGRARAKQIDKHGVLTISTMSAPMSSHIRLGQQRIIEATHTLLAHKITKVRVIIGG